ncbi:DUF397 domain-containing protein [Streptomyces sasae]|nr:DUF397 domain-containing protein [Streptomyces sasae]
MNRIETAVPAPAARTGVRDSKNPDGPALLLPADAWTQFVAYVADDAV